MNDDRTLIRPLRDRKTALAVLREAVSSGVNQIDTSDYYGPHITNHLIREALHPYSDDLVIVTTIGARRGEDASWLAASSPAELAQAVHDNLRNLSLDVLDVVNLRNMLGTEASIEPPLTPLADLQRQGLVRHIGLSIFEKPRRGRTQSVGRGAPTLRWLDKPGCQLTAIDMAWGYYGDLPPGVSS